MESLKKVKKEKSEDNNGGVAGKRRRRAGKGAASSSNIQSLLTAASMLEGGAQGEGSEQGHAHSQLWSAEGRCVQCSVVVTLYLPAQWSTITY